MKRYKQAGILILTALLGSPMQVFADEIESRQDSPAVVLSEEESSVLTTGEAFPAALNDQEEKKSLQDTEDLKPGWNKTEQGTQFIKEDGTLAKNEIFEVEGNLYAFNPDGYLCSGYAEIDGKTYYADPDHNNALLLDSSFDGHYFDENGVMQESGWEKTNAGWKLKLTDGSYASNGFYEQDGSTYYFDKKGIMKTGWIKENGHDYYLSNSGELIKNWFVQNKWYVDEKGIYHPETWEKKDGSWMLLLGNGQYARDTFRVSEDGHAYCFDNNGYMSTGWKRKDGKDYYFVTSGEMARKRWIEGKYYVGADGAWIRDGWKQVENGHYAWVYGDGSRVVSTKKKIGVDDYYFDENGWMHTGWKEIDGHWYYFGDTGAALKKTRIDDWYLNSTGIAYTGHDIEIAEYCDGVYERTGLDLYKTFCWVVDSMRYQTLPIPLPTVDGRSELQNYARQAMTLKGNCYCYAALFWYLADGLGYHPEFVQGGIPSPNYYSRHGWVVMYENGTKYYYDPESSYELARYIFKVPRWQSPINYDR